MAQGKSNQAKVETFTDHQVIKPANKLAKKAIAKVSLPGDDQLKRAEKALSDLSSEFGTWMNEECDRLHKARNAMREFGFSKARFDELFLSAHDIKGDAATFGFPKVAPVAESLCRVLEHTPDPEHIPMELIDRHVDAIRAIVREHLRPDIGDIAPALIRKLRGVSDEYLADVNRHRPDYLENVMAPSIAPDTF
jgi:chemotaxis protein histidine kinase CheA